MYISVSCFYIYGEHTARFVKYIGDKIFVINISMLKYTSKMITETFALQKKIYIYTYNSMIT